MDYKKYDIILKNILNTRCDKSNIDFTSRNNNIILYGNTELGKFVHDLLLKYNIYTNFIDSNMTFKNTSGKNFTKSISNTIVLVCHIDIPYNKIKKNLLHAGFSKIMHCYEYIWRFYPETNIENGWLINRLTNNMIKRIYLLHNKLYDEQSRKSFLSALSWRIIRTDIFKCDIMPPYRETFPSFLNSVLTPRETFIDCGSYVGNTIYNFLKCVDGKFNQIIACEPDMDNYKLLVKNCHNFMSEKQFFKTNFLNNAIYKESNICYTLLSRGGASKIIKANKSATKTLAIDDLNLVAPTIIKFHIEGDEFYALQGAIKTIKKYRPILVIALYHSEKNFFEIPYFLISNLSNYRFYHRKYKYCGQSEIIYSIPEERYP